MSEQRIPKPVEVNTYPHAADMTVSYVAKVADSAMMNEYAATAIYKLICERIAERYVDEHYIQIAAKLDQNAIANLAIAEASKKIAEEIQRRPNIVHEVETQIFQRGIFGGVKRVG